ncbi:hypothetical protein [Pandoravirus japonicus]|uniref:Uncharacterized protein n=1 Tax=Pandoravirus japonicus TaxID=2823154 RepID=A0A811BQ74_9VIRU|nr:hypothetical protein [Pandoravirus japonicus]
MVDVRTDKMAHRFPHVPHRRRWTEATRHAACVATIKIPPHALRATTKLAHTTRQRHKNGPSIVCSNTAKRRQPDKYKGFPKSAPR